MEPKPAYSCRAQAWNPSETEEAEVNGSNIDVELFVVNDKLDRPGAGQVTMLILLLVILVLSLTGCEQLDTIMPTIDTSPPGTTPIMAERPTVNVPYELRQENWLGRQREGSCVWATTISLLNWQGRYRTADWVRKNRGDGEWPEHMAEGLNDAGIRYAYTVEGDVKFLEWACKTRRGCGVTVNGGAHMVALVHLDSKWAAILDNNDITKFIWVPRTALIAEWQASHGWAVAPIYTPAPPMPQ